MFNDLNIALIFLIITFLVIVIQMLCKFLRPMVILEGEKQRIVQNIVPFHDSGRLLGDRIDCGNLKAPGLLLIGIWLVLMTLFNAVIGLKLIVDCVSPDIVRIVS